MIRLRTLESIVLSAVGATPDASSNEIARVVNKRGTDASRASVRNALKALEHDGHVANVGALSDAWRRTTGEQGPWVG